MGDKDLVMFDGFRVGTHANQHQYMTREYEYRPTMYCEHTHMSEHTTSTRLRNETTAHNVTCTRKTADQCAQIDEKIALAASSIA